MQTKSKSNSVVTHRLLESGVLAITVKGAGVQLEGAEQPEDAVLCFDPKLCAETTRQRAELHGWIQRISDAAAIGRDTKTGLPATPRTKLEAMTKLVDYYQSGAMEWKMAGTGGAGGGSGAAEKALLQRCLVQVYPERTAEQLSAWIGKRTAAERTALLSSEKIKPLADQFRKEAGSGIDADELLSEFEGTEEGEAA